MPNPFMRNQILINGVWGQAEDGATFDVVNPADGSVIGVVPKAGAAETRRAIDAAHAAFRTFKKTTALERSVLLRKLHDLIVENAAPLAELLTLEQGKPLAEAKVEIAQSAGYVLWFAEEARRTYGATIPSPWRDRRIMVNKQPVGVVAAITPWNFPSSMLARKIGPALAAGCTIVVKPAGQTPYSALAWGILCEKAGFPQGAVNILTGNAQEIGDELCANPLVRKLTFTGSTAVGKKLIAKSASTVKKVSMELGGNAPFIVFDDADIDRAVSAAVASKFRNSGQTCVCTNRFLVQAGVYSTFLEKFRAAVSALSVGSGMDAGVQQGPLIDEAAVRSAEEFVADAVAKGGALAIGGKRHARGGGFFEPTIIADAKPDMSIMTEEIFGPIAPLSKFETEEEVLDLANRTEFGLACYFYTADLARAYRMMEELEYGMVGVNEALIATVEAPFGGMKESGLGREGAKEGIEDYLDAKYVCVGGLGI